MARPDGVLEIDAHYVLRDRHRRIHRGAARGLRAASPEVTARIASGEIVDASEYYFRTHIRLATSSPRLAWMNDLLGVSTGERRRDTVRIDVHEVL